MAVAENRRRSKVLEERVDRLEARVDDLERRLDEPWWARLLAVGGGDRSGDA